MLPAEAIITTAMATTMVVRLPAITVAVIPAPARSYSAPAAAPASDFAMLEDDDAQLPF